MKIFSADQIRSADAFAIENNFICSLDLMENAAEACVKWLGKRYRKCEIFHIFCGQGNNGGDGFAIARMLYQKGFEVNVFVDKPTTDYTDDALFNLQRIKGISGITILDFNEVGSFNFKPNSVIIDALFGTGLNRSIEGKSAELINKLNQIPFPKISIDIPSGLFADEIFEENPVIFEAEHTLSFQFWKKVFLHPETGKFCGRIQILDIGLSEEFIENEPSDTFVIDEHLIQKIYSPRNDFSHKGDFGKTTIIAGSFGKMGAAVLATKGALKSGSGITFALAPKCGYEILQTACPEAMYLYGGKDFIDSFETDSDTTVGIGPGLGSDPETENAFLKFLSNYTKPLILDADAINLLANDSENLRLIPKNSVITPHPKEFERLFGETENSFERLDLAREKAKELGVFIVLKDHHTQIITPEHQVFYNITGNSGMAKGGTGDVLLGIITSLLAQNYLPEDAAMFGVWLHGKAGDFAVEKCSTEAMLPSDLIDELGNVFQSLN